MKELHNIVKGPCLTEKSNRLQEANGTIVFKVAPGANKIEIGQAVELKSIGRTSDWKKAYITLSEGEIDFLAEL